MATVFLEPSTRTRLSFETAMLKLGGKVISIPEPNGSSRAKGETLYDTVATVAQYADIVVVRSSEPISEWGQVWSKTKLLINAGDGNGQHPTQAIADLYTIWKRFGRISKLRIGIVGDLEDSRTIHSLTDILRLRPQTNEVFLLNTTQNDYHYPFDFDGNHILKSCEELEELLPTLDVLYTNRVQEERKLQVSAPKFFMTREHLAAMKPNAIVMNPGPRREELHRLLDDDPKIVFFEQARNGLYARMALLLHTFEN